MKLYKEIAKMREEIERDKSTTIKSYGGDEKKLDRFIKLISHGWNCGNAVKFAFQRKSLGCVEEIFKILTDNVRNHPEIRYILRSLDRYIVRLARTNNVHAEGDALIVNAIKNEQHTPVLFLLESLEDKQQYNLIEQKGCKSDCSGNPHGEGCNAEYNLLMLALETSPDDRLLPSYIVDIVCQHPDLIYKTEIAMGKEEPEIYDQTPNSIRLAATTGRAKLAIKLLKECLQRDHRYRAFLEVGPPKSPEVSAMASMLEVNDIECLEMLREPGQGTALRQTLMNRPRVYNNFLGLEMTQDAIKQFNKIQLLQYNYLIPKPSELSRPMALIFYNTFAGTGDYLEDAREEAEELKEALQSLGWGDNEIQTFGDWTFHGMIDQLKTSMERKGEHCSLFLLYITSHGKDNHICGVPENGNEPSQGTRWMITRAIADILPNYIPKVLIFDICREGRTIASHTITDGNILLLNATVMGEKAKATLYIKELARQIKDWADKRVSFVNMHKDAARSLEQNYFGLQIAHAEFTAKEIMLRQYKGNENNCMRCKVDIKRCYNKCMICPNCYRWYHPHCAGCTQEEVELSKRSTYEVKCAECKAYKNSRSF